MLLLTRAPRHLLHVEAPLLVAPELYHFEHLVLGRLQIAAQGRQQSAVLGALCLHLAAQRRHGGGQGAHLLVFRGIARRGRVAPQSACRA